MFYPGCGHKLKGGESFCTNCGRSLKKKHSSPTRQVIQKAEGNNLIGFSENYKYPEILAVAKSNRKHAFI